MTMRTEPDADPEPVADPDGDTGWWGGDTAGSFLLSRYRLAETHGATMPADNNDKRWSPIQSCWTVSNCCFSLTPAVAEFKDFTRLLHHSPRVDKVRHFVDC